MPVALACLTVGPRGCARRGLHACMLQLGRSLTTTHVLSFYAVRYGYTVNKEGGGASQHSTSSVL